MLTIGLTTGSLQAPGLNLVRKQVLVEVPVGRHLNVAAFDFGMGFTLVQMSADKRITNQPRHT